jgi:hypothetical protein
MNSVLTDHSHLQAKVNLRLAHLPDKPVIKVLDAFYGKGIIWEYIAARTKIKIEIVGIEKKPIFDDFVLFGDNKKFFPSISLEKFDVIDLDAYGVPFDQLEHIFDYDHRKKIHHRIFVTFIQSIYGRLPLELLRRLGYSEKMVSKIPALFDRNGIEKFKAYLALRGISRIFIKSSGKKYYIFFET